MSVMSEARQAAGRRSLWQNELARGVILQVLAAAIVLALTVFFVHNTTVNLAKRGIASGFGFLDGTAGFDISISLIPYTLQSSYRAGLPRRADEHADGVGDRRRPGDPASASSSASPGCRAISSIAKLAAAYVDIIRNIPLLAQIIFWYFGVLAALPGVRQSLDFLNLKLLFLNTRGLYMPAPILQPGFWIIPAALVVGLIATFVVRALGASPPGADGPAVSQPSGPGWP